MIKVTFSHWVEGEIAFSLGMGEIGIVISSSSTPGIVDWNIPSSKLVSSSSWLEWGGDEVQEGNGATGVGLVTVASWIKIRFFRMVKKMKS